MLKKHTAAALSIAFAAAATPLSAAELERLDVEGTQFKARFSDGRVLSSPDLVGATLTIAKGSGALKVASTRSNAIPATAPDPSRHPRR